MNTLSKNLRYLLLKKGIKPSNWTSVLASTLRCEESKAKTLLAGETVDFTHREIEALEFFGSVPKDMLESEELWEGLSGEEILTLNLAYLLDTLPHGEKKNLADTLGVDATTISRWKSGKQKPTRRKMQAILEHFNLPNSTDLKGEPVFLSTMPLGEAEVKTWLHGKIDLLDAKTLNELLPALVKLLKD